MQDWAGLPGWEVQVDMPQIFSRYLSSDGTTAGGKNMTVNGFTNPVRFWLSGPNRLEVHRLTLYVRASTVRPNDYGNRGALLNGLTLIQAEPDGVTVVLDLFDGEPVTRNCEWRGVCHDYAITDQGPGSRSYTARFAFQFGSPLVLDPMQRIQATVRDDLTSLSRHRILAQGVVHVGTPL